MSGITPSSGAGGWASTQELAHAHSGICRAVALGWQVAQLFHSSVHRGPACTRNGATTSRGVPNSRRESVHVAG